MRDPNGTKHLLEKRSNKMKYLKSKLVCSLLLVCMVASIAAAKPADDDKPFIFINSASELGNIMATNSGLKRFAEIATEKGFKIDHGIQPSLANAPLNDIDVYVLIDYNIVMTSADKVALRQWIRDGGILLTGDLWGLIYNESFIGEFGVGYGPFDYFGRHFTLPPNSPLAKPLIINDLAAAYMRELQVTNNTRAQVILRDDDGNPMMTRSISYAGKGEVLVIGCPYILFNDASDPGIQHFDNDRFVKNLFTYIKNKFDENNTENAPDLNLYKLKTKGGSNFLPGDKIKFVAKIKNIGNSNGKATEIAFYLSKLGSSLTAKVEITSSGVPAINSKKKKKIIKTVFLPNGLKPGTYEVIAVVDPDGTGNDKNSDNNTLKSKKKIIIE